MTDSYSILIIEDEKNILDFMARTLRSNGYKTITSETGQSGLSIINSQCPDLILLDLGLPDMDGNDIISSVRKWTSCPIIVISARAGEQDKVAALDLGADDYITKPFNPLEVVARVKTQLRRYVRYNNAANTKEKDTPIAEHDVRGLIINKNTHKCTLYGKEVTLTPIEFSILWYLCENRGKVIPSEELFENVWGEQYLDNNNTVMAHIGRLREKLNEPAKKPKFIKTVWGVGYTIEK